MAFLLQNKRLRSWFRGLASPRALHPLLGFRDAALGGADCTDNVVRVTIQSLSRTKCKFYISPYWYFHFISCPDTPWINISCEITNRWLFLLYLCYFIIIFFCPSKLKSSESADLLSFQISPCSEILCKISQHLSFSLIF